MTKIKQNWKAFAAGQVIHELPDGMTMSEAFDFITVGAESLEEVDRRGIVLCKDAEEFDYLRELGDHMLELGQAAQEHDTLHDAKAKVVIRVSAGFVSAVVANTPIDVVVFDDDIASRQGDSAEKREEDWDAAALGCCVEFVSRDD